MISGLKPSLRIFKDGMNHLLPDFKVVKHKIYLFAESRDSFQHSLRRKGLILLKDG